MEHAWRHRGKKRYAICRFRRVAIFANACCKMHEMGARITWLEKSVFYRFFRESGEQAAILLRLCISNESPSVVSRVCSEEDAIPHSSP
jgi:hypothetical protein